jgi:hypothetical protein
MVRSRYLYLLQQRRRWFVRMAVLADVRAIIGQSIFKVPNGQTDEHRAANVAAPIIAELPDRIRTVREAGKRPEQVTADNLAERCRTEQQTNPEQAEITQVTEVIDFVLKAQGHTYGQITPDKCATAVTTFTQPCDFCQMVNEPLTPPSTSPGRPCRT